MDPSNSQKRRMRPEDDRGAHASQIPRPFNKSSSRIPIQLSAPPRAHQYHRPGPPNPSNRQPSPGRHDRAVNGSDSSFNIPPPPIPPQGHSYSNRQASDQQDSRTHQPSSRHLSHISALSVSQPDTDSRPVSEAFVVSPALPSEAVSEMGEEEEYNARSASHSRATSRGRRTKTTTANNRSRKNSIPIRDSETLPSGDQSATMEALTAAIRQGLNPTAASSRSLTPKPISEATGVRMPFQAEEPSSPSSVYTDVTATNKHLSMPLSSYRGYDHRDTPSTLVEQEANDYDKSQYGQDLPTPMSTHPIMAGLGPGMSSKIPPGKRPLKLDIGAVRDAEARGSMTSLSDLIKRATRLASNLDRGKTASRLGHLDMFGSTDRLGNMRNSTYSDVLDAFPPPAHGTSTPNGRPATMWPHGDKQFMASKSSLGRFMDTNEKTETGEKPRRKCCGLLPVVFVLLLIGIVLLVAAAVLVPVFLLVLPKQHHGVDLSQCHSTHACQNGGHSVSANDVCSCVCVDGFTGSDCSTEKDPECVTAPLSDAGSSYDNATVGSSILPLLQNAQTSFAIPLNTTKLLSRFAYNNLSCASENSLVDFGATHSTTSVKRFVIVPGMMSTEPHAPALNLPPSESKQTPRFVIVEGLPDAAEELPLLPTHTLQPRQDATQSANSIVFAISGDAASTPTATAVSGTATATASSSSSSPTTKLNASDNQLDFAATVVLYVLETSSQVNDAVTANQMILAHFQESNPANSTVVVKDGKDGMQADFQKFQIKFSNGTTVGGTGSVKVGS